MFSSCGIPESPVSQNSKQKWNNWTIIFPRDPAFWRSRIFLLPFPLSNQKWRDSVSRNSEQKRSIPFPEFSREKETLLSGAEEQCTGNKLVNSFLCRMKAALDTSREWTKFKPYSEMSIRSKWENINWSITWIGWTRLWLAFLYTPACINVLASMVPTSSNKVCI